MIVDDFLDPTRLEFVQEEIKKVKDNYSRDGYEHSKKIRDHFDPRFCGTQLITNPRNILYSVFDRYFWDQLWIGLHDHGDYTFRHALQTRVGKVLLSAYANKDYYGMHVDTDMDSIITAVLMLSINKNFEGGHLVIQDEIINFKNNTLIVFPSCIEHGVTKIESQSNKYEDQRFSLQYFISAVPLKNPLIDESSNIQ